MKTSSFDLESVLLGALIDDAANFKVRAAETCPDLSDNMRFLIDYFAKKRGDKAFNRRADLVPSELTRLLPRVTLLDAVYDAKGRLSDARYRLMGTDITHLYGEATGKLVGDYHDRAVLRRVREIGAWCLKHQGPALGESVGLSGGKPFLNVRVLYVPFSEDGTTVSQFFVYSGIRRRVLED